MSNAPATTRYRRLKVALAIVAAIVAAPIMIVIFLANMNGERR